MASLLTIFSHCLTTMSSCTCGRALLVGSENETQQRHTQTKGSLPKVPIRATQFMLVMCALLLAPLLGNAEYEFHTGKN